MGTPDFILDLRAKVGTTPLWLSGVTAVITRDGGERTDHTLGALGALGALGTLGTVGPASMAGTATTARQVLLIRRADNGAWTPVTGIIDPGEHPADAAVRETAEEAGVRIAVDYLAWVNVTDVVVYPNGDRSRYLDHTFACRWLDGDPAPADDETTDARWWSLDALPPMSPDLSARIAVVIDSLARGDRTTRLTPYEAGD